MARSLNHPPCAFLFLASSQASKCLTLDEAFLKALRIADPRGATVARIYRGRLVVSQLTYRTTAISSELKRTLRDPSRTSSQISVSRQADMGLYSVLVGDFVESSLAQWNTVDATKFWDQIANHSVDMTVASSLAPKLGKAMDKLLLAHPKFIGALVPDLGNPLHRQLFIEYLFKDAFVRSSRLYLCAGYDGDYNGSFSGARTFSHKREIVLAPEDFERRAPQTRIPEALSARGLVSEMRFRRRAALNVHEVVVAHLSRGSSIRSVPGPFVWDLSQLPSSPEQASVQARKLTDYLLNPAHSTGGSKAKFFLKHLAITRADAAYLHAQLLDGLEKVDFDDVRIDRHGIRFSAVLPVLGRNGATATIATGWIIRPGERAAFVTAYPGPKNEALEKMATAPAIVSDELTGPERWKAIYELADAAGAQAADTFIPKPIVVGGRVYMEGNCGGASVVVGDARRGFARWLKASGLGRPGYPRGYEVAAPTFGQSADKATAYAEAFAKLLRRNGVSCDVEGYLD